jgi:hypothetical protein
VRRVGLVILSLGIASLVSAVVTAAASGLVVMAVILGIACVLLMPIGVAVLRAERRARAGEPLRGEATVKAVVESGMNVGEGTEVVLDLDVAVPGKPSYGTTVTSVIPLTLIPLCAPGHTLVVLVDAGDPGDVTIDWGADRA